MSTVYVVGPGSVSLPPTVWDRGHQSAATNLTLHTRPHYPVFYKLCSFDGRVWGLPRYKEEFYTSALEELVEVYNPRNN